MTNTFQTRVKPLLTATLLAGLLAASGFSALAQSAPPATPTPGATPTQPQAHRGMRHDQRERAMSPERMQQHMARRTADLKARLKIEPAQESAWTTFTEAMKPPADMMQRRRAIRTEMQALTTPERIDRMRALRTERQAQMDKRGDAVKTFYAALNAEQKKVFDTRPTMQGRGGHGGKHGGHHGRMHGDAGGHEHGQPQS